MERKITRVDTIPQINSSLPNTGKTRRVAAYARVSTDKTEQQNSYENQLDYYPKLVESRPDWEFIALYSDEGISATSTKNRDGFNQLINDALDKKFDLIITKSISRFARNTVDSLTTVRKLKAAGVEVWFEKEDLFSFDSKGEFMLTLLSSLAQEESRSISENTAWAIRKNMANGIYSMPYGRFLGYEKGNDGKPSVVEDEAAVVRRIYRLFLEGRSTIRIAEILSAEEIPSPGGCENWLKNTVRSILTNEKFAGNALLQKKYTADFLTKKQMRNCGELPQFFVEDGHDAIVSQAVFDEVQKRISINSKYTQPDINFLSNKVFCGVCGGMFGRRIIANYKEGHEHRKYRRIVWRCEQVHGKGKFCKSLVLYEASVAFLFNWAILEILKTRPEIVKQCLRLVYDSLDEINNRGTKENRKAEIATFLSNFAQRSPLDIPFDDVAWRVLIQRVVVTQDGYMQFFFRCGEKFIYEIPRFSMRSYNFIAGSVLEESLRVDGE